MSEGAFRRNICIDPLFSFFSFFSFFSSVRRRSRHAGGGNMTPLGPNYFHDTIEFGVFSN
jgi:hypothetical protein